MKNLKLKEPFILILVGPPLSGKSTFIKSLNDYDFTIISRDDILMEEYCKLGYDDNSYNKAFNIVNQKNINTKLEVVKKQLCKTTENIIIDMTNMRSKKRRLLVNQFRNHTAYAIVFPLLKMEEYQKRNEKRLNDENKDLSLKIVESMIDSFQEISDCEGFHKVINL